MNGDEAKLEMAVKIRAFCREQFGSTGGWHQVKKLVDSIASHVQAEAWIEIRAKHKQEKET